MKVTEIELGRRYAARLRISKARGGVSRMSPILHITAVDTAGICVIGEYPAMVLTAEGKKRRSGNPDSLVGNRFYVMGTKRVRIPAVDVICFSEEWQYDQPDGRAEAPRIRYEGGHRIVEPRMPVLG